MEVRYDYTRENTLGEKVDVSETMTVAQADFGGDLRNALYSLWSDNLGRLMIYAETVGLILNKIVVVGDSEWVNIPDENLSKEFDRQPLRVVIASQMDYGDSQMDYGSSREDYYMTRGSNGAEAKLNFWAAIKRDGNGFCNTAASVKPLSITVQKQDASERVIFERTPADVKADSYYHDAPLVMRGSPIDYSVGLPIRSLEEYKRVGAYNTPELVQAMQANQKINYIKTLREVFSLGLMEAKDITEYRFQHNRAYFS